jgi:hypothetical protein
MALIPGDWAAPAAILRALGRAVWRDLSTFRSLAGNNFALFAALLMLQPASAQFFVLLLALLLLGPLSSDPLGRVPQGRFAVWPLSEGQRLGVRILSPLLSPVAWLAVPILLAKAGWQVTAIAVGLSLLLQGVSATWKRFAAKRPRHNPFLYAPALPGAIGRMAQKDLRQLLSMLDPWLAGMLCVAGVAARVWTPKLDPEAMPILALLVVTSMSTYAQSLFGLDGLSGRRRLHLFPRKGWQILAAKGGAYLGVAVILTAPLAPLSGLAGGMIALGVGQWAAIAKPQPQARWRFSGAEVIPMGLYQMIPMFTIGVAVARSSVWYLAPATVFYLGSVWWCGRIWDRG